MSDALKERRSPPWIAVTVIVLVAALAGTAVAGPDVRSSAVTKKKVKKIADKRIDKAAPGLSVAHADTADAANTAATSDNALALGGVASSGFVQGTGRLRSASLDVPSNGGSATTVLGLPGLGTLTVPAGTNGCNEPTTDLRLRWRNGSSSTQDTWFLTVNENGVEPLAHGAPDPGETEDSFGDGLDQQQTLRIQSRGSAAAVTIFAYVEIFQVTNPRCRISVQALVSG